MRDVGLRPASRAAPCLDGKLEGGHGKGVTKGWEILASAGVLILQLPHTNYTATGDIPARPQPPHLPDAPPFSCTIIPAHIRPSPAHQQLWRPTVRRWSTPALQDGFFHVRALLRGWGPEGGLAHGWQELQQQLGALSLSGSTFSAVEEKTYVPLTAPGQTELTAIPPTAERWSPGRNTQHGLCSRQGRGKG